MLRLAIVGSTNLTVKQIDDVYTIIETIIVAQRVLLDSAYSDIEIVSGGANGVDLIGEGIADQLGCSWKIFRPDVSQWLDEEIEDCGGDPLFLRGFKSRNLQVADYCDRLWCIRSIQSRTYGSGWTADRAEEMGKRVIRITV